MKRFEFTLARVLDIRRKQADIAVAQMLALKARMSGLDQEEQAVKQALTDAQSAVQQGGSATGTDLASLARFAEHTRNRQAEINRRRQALVLEIQQHTQVCLEADRRVKLLEKLETKQKNEWKVSSDKELEALAADSHLALLLAERRSKGRLVMEEVS